MLSKSSMEIPYYSDGPLSEKTSWVAFPVLVSTKNKHYVESLNSSKVVLKRLSEGANSLSLVGGKVTEIPQETKYKDLETIVEFSKQNADCISKVYSCIFLQCEEGATIWDKMSTISQCLDFLNAEVENYKSNKFIELYLGVEFYRGK